MASNFDKNAGKGRLATDRYDFENHIGGVNRRHQDDHIDLSAPLTEITASNVHEALVEINNKVLNTTFFVTIGDGFDIYEGGVFQDTSNAAPALDSEFIDVFTDTTSIRYQRLRDGGVLLIKSGTYKITSTIDVPPGITIMGEGFGTKLINRIVANGGVEAPMFRFKGDIDHAEDRSIVSIDPTYDPFLNSKSCKLVNIVIADNYVKPTYFGDTAYRAAQNTTLPLVYLEHGAGLECDGVLFLGRSLLSDPALTTHSAIGLDPLSGTSDSTFLNVHNCKIDGFNRAVTYTTANGTKDYLYFKNNHVRIFGPMNGVSNVANSNVITTNDCNIDISNNHIWTETQLLGIVYFNDFVSGSIPRDARCRVTVGCNQIAYTKTDNNISNEEDIVIVSFNASIASDAPLKIDLLIMGNLTDADSGFKIQINQSGPKLLMENHDVEISCPETGSVQLIGGDINLSTDDGLIVLATTGTGQQIELVSNSYIQGTAGGSVYWNATTEVSLNSSTEILLNTPTINATATDEIYLSAANAIHVDAEIINFGGAQTSSITAITTNLVVTWEYFIFADTTGGAITITLPEPNSGRTIIIKDIGGAASTDNIILARNGGTGMIEGVSSNFTIEADYAKLKLVADGTNWWFV